MKMALVSALILLVLTAVPARSRAQAGPPFALAAAPGPPPVPPTTGSIDAISAAALASPSITGTVKQHLLTPVAT